MNINWVSFRLCRRPVLLAAAALCVAGTALVHRPVADVGGVPASVIGPLLAEDWSRVVRVTAAPCCGQAQSPVLRLIRAHALLAINRNTDATCILLHTNKQDRQAWLKWTSEMVRRYPNQPASHYLHADALARQMRYPEAIAEFSRAMTLAPHEALALNARGQAYAAVGDWSHAAVDFEDAARADPRLADAPASRAWLFIQKKAGARGAVTWFTRALEITPGFVMARHGLGCAEMALGRIRDGSRDFAAPARTCAARLAAENALEVVAFLRGMSREELAESLGRGAPGTTLERSFSGTQSALDAWRQNPTQHNFNRVMNATNSASPAEQRAWVQHTLDPLLHAHPDLAARAGPELREVARWNSGLGGMMGHLIGGLSMSAAAALASFRNPYTTGAAAALAGAGHITEAGLTQWSHRNVALSGLMEHNSAVLHHAPGITWTPGGAYLSHENARLDDGEWPFTADYGLLYPPLPSSSGSPALHPSPSRGRRAVTPAGSERSSG